jgi:hypothetical protein
MVGLFAVVVVWHRTEQKAFHRLGLRMKILLSQASRNNDFGSVRYYTPLESEPNFGRLIHAAVRNFGEFAHANLANSASPFMVNSPLSTATLTGTWAVPSVVDWASNWL